MRVNIQLTLESRRRQRLIGHKGSSSQNQALFTWRKLVIDTGIAFAS